MAKSKRFLSIVLAVLMAFSAMSCLGSVVASATAAGYEHDNDNWDIGFSETNNWDGIDSMDDLRTKYGTWDTSENPWMYIGIEALEYNSETGEWEDTDHYVQPGQELMLRFYIKGDCYIGSATTIHTQYDRAFFDVVDGSATTTYLAKYDLAGDGLDNNAYPANKTDISLFGGDVNAASPIGENLTGVTTTMKQATQLAQYKNSSGKTYNTNTGLSQDVTQNWDVVTSTLKNDATYTTPFDASSDEYVFEFKIKVRDTTTNIEGVATENYAGVANGSVGHLGLEEYTTRWYNGTKCPAYVCWTDDESTSNLGCTAPTAGTLGNLHTEDCNHTFIIGEPGGASDEYTATFMDGTDTVASLTGTTVTAPAAPTAAAGQTFAGWSDGTTTYAAGESITLTANTTFTAVWTSSGYSVKYYDGTTEYADLAQTGVSGSIQLAAAQSKAGYRFAGWTDGSTTYAAGSYYTVSANTTLTAQWTTLYTATFTGDGITTSTAQYAEGETITFPTAPARDNYTAVWTPTTSTMPAADTTFTLSYVGNAASIVFDSNGGSAVATITGNYGDTVTAPAAPTKAGYTFAGWTLDGAAYTFSTMPATTITLVAQWTANNYAVTYVDGDTTVATYNIDFGSAITVPAAPTKEGYTFAGWKDADDKAPADYDAMPDNALTFTAQWTANQYTINFYSETGSYISGGKQTFGNALAMPADQSASGKTFSGWTGSDGSFIAAGTTAMVPAANVDYTATFDTVTYYITYMLDGVEYSKVPMTAGAVISDPTPDVAEGKQFDGWSSHSATMPAEDITVTGTTSFIDYTIAYRLDSDSAAYVTYTAHYGDTMPVPEDPSKAGYEFEGWDNDATTVTGDATITAIFNALSYDVTFTYGLDGEESEEASVRFGDSLTAADFPDAAVEGYGLTWTYDGAAVKFPFAVPALAAGSEIEFVATYGAVTKTLTYYIIYAAGDVRQDGAQETLAFGSDITLRDVPTATGYTYSAWTLADGSAVPATMPAEDVAVYTTRTANVYHDTWYDINGTTVLYEEDVAFGSAIPEKTLPSHEGYENLRWDGMKSTQEANDMTFTAKGTAGDVNYTVNIYTEQLDGTYACATSTRTEATGATATATNQDKTKTGYTLSTTHESVLSATVEGDGSTVLSVYLDLNRYNVYVTDDENTYTVEYKYGETPADVTAAGKTGYSFDKCTWSKTAGGASIAKPTAINSDLYVTVNYTINSYNIITNCDGATTETAVVYNAAMPEVAALTKDGYEFKGWYTDEAYTTAYVAGSAMPANDVNLYGYFEAITYTYTFKSNDSTEVITGTVGQTYTIPTAAAKEGWSFKAWSPVATGTFGTADQEFNAVYTVNSYNLTFKNGDTVIKTVKVAYGTAAADITVPTTPTKVGNTFAGWDTIPDTMPANDVEVVATWTVNNYDALFYANSGDTEAKATVNAAYGSDFTAPDALADTEYYTFGGWKLNGTSDVYAAGATITMSAEGMTFFAVWNQNTDACYVKSVERITTPYYQKGGADYKVTVAQSVNSLTITYTNASGSAITSTYSKPGYYLGNESIKSIEAGENGTEIWTINAVLAEMEGYKIYATLDNGTTDAENAFQFAVTYDTKDADQVAKEFISAACDKTSMVRGQTATWTVTTSQNVTWLEFTGNYTTAAGETKTLTTYYKYSNYTSATTGTTVTDNTDGTRTWVVPMALSYTASDLTVTENWTILYKVNGSSKWDDSNYSNAIVIGRTEDALNPAPAASYDKYTLISVSADKANAAVADTVTFTVNVTNDVTKVRIGYSYTADGAAKTKAVTYQKTSSNVKGIVDNGDGTATWTISYKVPATAVGTTDFNVQVRGDAWGEAQSETIVVA